MAEATLADYFKNTAPAPAPESTMKDYFNVLNPLAVQFNYGETRAAGPDMPRTGVSLSDPATIDAYSKADTATKYEMLKARNDSDAFKIYQRRQYFDASQKAISQDGLLTQIGMGALPALASPTTLIPFGGVFKAAQTANKARTLWMAGAGASTAATANLIDEAAIGKQGMPTNYMSVAGTSIVLGGGLGFLSGALAGARSGNAARHLLQEGDVISAEAAKDNFVMIDQGTETLMIPKMEKSVMDKVPYVGEWFKSPIVKMYQSDNAAIRNIAAKISSPTVSVKDADGNYIVLGKTGMDVKNEIIGSYNSKVNIPVSEAYAMYKEAGGVGTREEFTQQIYKTYTEESIRLKNGSRLFAEEQAAPDIAAINEKYKQQLAERMLPDLYYKGSDGKLVPVSQEWVNQQELLRQQYTQALQYKNTVEKSIAQNKADAVAKIKNMEETLKADGVTGKAYQQQMKEWRAIVNEELKAQTEALRATVKVPKYREIPIIEKARTGDEVAAIKAELYGQRVSEKEAAIAKYIDEYYANNKPNFGNNQAITKGAEAFAKYFDSMLERSQNLKIEELMNLKPGRLYAPRNWDFSRINTLPKAEVMARLEAGLKADLRNNYANDADLKTDAEELYSILVDKDEQSKLGQGKAYYTKDLPFKKRLAARNIRIDESKLGDLVHNNFEEVAGLYNYFMSGRMAVQHAFGTDDLSVITKDIKDAAEAKGMLVDAKELKIVTNTIDDMLGVRRMNQLGNDVAWEISRNLMTYNSARLMGGAGGNQIIELATIAMMNMAKGIMLKNFSGSAKEVAKMLFQEKGVSSDLGKVLLNSGYMESALHAHRANRIADTEAGFAPRLFERTLNSVADFQMKYNGQRYFTALSEDLTGGAIINYIQRASVKDEAMFSRWGLTMEDVQSLKAVFDKDNKNFLQNMTPEQLDKFQLAVNRGVAEWVVQPNSIHLPDWFKGAGPTAKLLFQFMKFPMIAQETLLRRGLSEDRAAFVAGIFGAAMTYTTLKYLREEASLAMGTTEEIDRKYDIFNNEEHFYRALMESVNYAANLGMLTTTWNYGAAALQKPELGREWANRDVIDALGGPSVGLVKDALETLGRGVNEGDFTSEKQLNSLRQLLPLMNLPGINEAGKALANEYGD